MMNLVYEGTSDRGALQLGNWFIVTIRLTLLQSWRTDIQVDRLYAVCNNKQRNGS